MYTEVGMRLKSGHMSLGVVYTFACIQVCAHVCM